MRTDTVRPRLIAAVASAACAVLALPAIQGNVFAAKSTAPKSGPATLPSTTFVSAPPTGAKGPDDITRMAIDGVDHGRSLIWTAYQNGINPDGTPGSAGGPTQSTVAGYDPETGGLVKTIAVTGKIDGLSADPAIERLIATVNEDSNSAFNLVDPAIGTVTTYHYSPDPAVSGNGGTDSIAVRDGRIYVTHSNPNDATQAAEYKVTLDATTHTAHLSPVFFDNDTAVDAVSGMTVTLALSDPDTNAKMSHAAPRFAGDLATISQADGQIVFASHLQHAPKLTVLNMTDNKAGNTPPIDGLAVATADRGTLYVVDAKAGMIKALDTKGWPAGTVFVGEPNDNGNPLVGTLDLFTGKITPLTNTFVSPKGLLFIADD